MSIFETIAVTESDTDSSAYNITILNGEYAGVVYKLGSVSFPDSEEPIMQFTYDIVSGSELIDDTKKFEQFIGDAIVEMLKEQLQKHETVFKGGV